MKMQSSLFALALLAGSCSAFVPQSATRLESSLHMSRTGEDRREFVTKVGWNFVADVDIFVSLLQSWAKSHFVSTLTVLLGRICCCRCFHRLCHWWIARPS